MYVIRQRVETNEQTFIKMEVVTKIVFLGYKLMRTISLKHLSFCNMIEIIPRGTASEMH